MGLRCGLCFLCRRCRVGALAGQINTIQNPRNFIAFGVDILQVFVFNLRHFRPGCFDKGLGVLVLREFLFRGLGHHGANAQELGRDAVSGWNGVTARRGGHGLCGQIFVKEIDLFRYLFCGVVIHGRSFGRIFGGWRIGNGGGNGRNGGQIN